MSIEASMPSGVAKFAREKAYVRRGFWAKAKRVAAGLPFAEDLLAAYFCAFDRETPRHVQVALIGALAYFVLPFDVIPDMMPLLGFTDDAAVLATAWPEFRHLQAADFVDHMRHPRLVDQSGFLAHVGDDPILGGAGAPAGTHTGDSQRRRGEREELAPAHPVEPFRGALGEFPLKHLLEFGGVGHLVEAAPVSLAGRL